MKPILKITVRFVDGAIFDYEMTSKELFHKLYTDDFGAAPPTHLSIQGVGENQKEVEVTFSYSDSNYIGMK